MRAPGEPLLDADGRERPAFLRGFPRDRELDAVVALFERGDYATVRSRASALAQASSDSEVRDAARELLARLEPDPLARRLLWVAAALLAFLTLWAYGHAH
ncbi:MAG: hypothetical protein IT376_00895 [Polyangiaceae bacterium]|nr:hypothetical protein [Polyangiaceae bacterium]